MTDLQDAKDEGSVDDTAYSLSYTRYLEKRLRALETEMRILQAERSRLEKETQTLRTELEKFRHGIASLQAKQPPRRGAKYLKCPYCGQANICDPEVPPYPPIRCRVCGERFT